MKMTQKQDDAYDKKHGIKEGSKRDIAQYKRNGVNDNKKVGKPRRLLSPKQRKAVSNLENDSWTNGMKGIQERQAKLMHK